MKTLNDLDLFLLSYLCNNKMGNVKLLRKECHHLHDYVFKANIDFLIKSGIVKYMSLKDDPAYIVLKSEAIAFALKPLEKFHDMKIRFIRTSLVKHKGDYEKASNELGLSHDYVGKMARFLNLSPKQL